MFLFHVFSTDCKLILNELFVHADDYSLGYRGGVSPVVQPQSPPPPRCKRHPKMSERLLHATGSSLDSNLPPDAVTSTAAAAATAKDENLTVLMRQRIVPSISIESIDSPDNRARPLARRSSLASIASFASFAASDSRSYV